MVALETAALTRPPLGTVTLGYRFKAKLKPNHGVPRSEGGRTQCSRVIRCAQHWNAVDDISQSTGKVLGGARQQSGQRTQAYSLPEQHHIIRRNGTHFSFGHTAVKAN